MSEPVPPGRLAAQDGAELMPTFSWPRERLVLLMAGGAPAFTQSIEGAEDHADQGIHLVREHKVDSKDVVIAVAASGTTPFTLACLREAKRCGALTDRHRQQSRNTAAEASRIIRSGSIPAPSRSRAPPG